MSCLSGMIFMGKTGMLAASHHSPEDENGKRRFVFYVFPHIGVSNSGKVGKLKRPGIDTEGGVCGALIAFHSELTSGYVNLDLNPDDIEYSLLKQMLFKKIKLGSSPTLIDLTYLAQEVALFEIEKLIAMVLTQKSHGKDANVDYAVYSGVQIHTATQDYICPQQNGGCYCVVNGVRTDIQFPEVENEFKAVYKKKHPEFNE